MVAKAKGLRKDQREWVLRRDGYRCQMFHYIGGHWVQCKATLHLEVHHLLPQRWIDKHFPHKEKHTPTNLITLCRDCCHSGPKGIHPDMYEAKKNYWQDKDSFKKAFRKRDEMVEKGEPYWNTKWDWMLVRRAKKLTGKYSRIEKFPR